MIAKGDGGGFETPSVSSRDARGRRIVYCSESPAAALLEILVHFEIDVRDLPARYRLLEVHAPDNLAIEHVNVGELPADWIDRTDVTRAVGDRRLQAAPAPLLRVPSAVVPETSNVLLNPAHRDARRVGVDQVSERNRALLARLEPLWLDTLKRLEQGERLIELRE